MSNCLPSRKGCCSNMKLSPALQETDATHVSPVRSHLSHPSQPRINPVSSEVAHTAMTENDAATAQAPGSSCPPNGAHPACFDQAQSPPCSIPPASPMSNPVFVWGEYGSASIMKSRPLLKWFTCAETPSRYHMEMQAKPLCLSCVGSSVHMPIGLLLSRLH